MIAPHSPFARFPAPPRIRTFLLPALLLLVASARAQDRNASATVTGFKQLDPSSELQVDRELPSDKAESLRKALLLGQEACAQEACDWENQDVYFDKDGKTLSLSYRTVRDLFRDANADTPAKQKQVLKEIKARYVTRTLSAKEASDAKAKVLAHEAAKKKGAGK